MLLPKLPKNSSNEEYFHELAKELGQEFRANTTIKKFANNSDIIGKYAEASVRKFVSRVVNPLRVSTGGVISPKLYKNPRAVPQIDTIIWSPNPFPALFESGDFGLIPRMSSFGIMEIKKSNYPNVGENIKRVIDRTEDLVSPFPPEDRDYLPSRGLGVICLKEYTRTDATLKELLKLKKAVVLLEKTDGELVVNEKGIWILINFLMRVRLRAKNAEGKVEVGPYLESLSN